MHLRHRRVGDTPTLAHLPVLQASGLVGYVCACVCVLIPTFGEISSPYRDLQSALILKSTGVKS